MEKLFQYAWMAGLSLALILYLVEAQNLSETELVHWSYVWIPIVIFGVAGSIALKKGKAADLDNPFRSALIRSLTWTVVGIVLLVIFYEVIWPGL